MATLPRLSEESFESRETTSSGSRAPNFSRPRPLFSTPSYVSQAPTIPRRSSARNNVQTVNAFHEPNREMPDEPRFSSESDRTATTNSENSAGTSGSEFAWDGQTRELKSSRRPGRLMEEQRYQPRSRPGMGAPSVSHSTMSSLYQPPPSQVSLASAATASSRGQHSIMKRVSVDQQSERLSMATNDQVEDTASHHTVSDDGSSSLEIGDEWRTSDYDTSGLTDKQIRKLIRKGVNPALYAEMQAAKKGKSKWIGSLTGNSFLA